MLRQSKISKKSVITLVVVFVVMIVLASMVANLEPELPAFMEDNGIQQTDPITGSASPNVVIVFFGDFANETSASISTSLSTLLQEFPNEVLVAWKDFPNSTLNNESARAAIAARCAQNQDAFWPYYDFLMSHQYELGAELYTEIAKELELDVKKFTSCLENLDTLDLVESSANEGLELDLIAAPTLFINGDRHTGKILIRDLRNLIEAEINS